MQPASMDRVASLSLLSAALALGTVSQRASDYGNAPARAAAAIAGAEPDVPPVDRRAQRAEVGSTVSRAADGLFYADAVVNGVRLRFLIDTGANVTVLTAADARRVGLNGAFADADRSVETVGGSVPMAMITLGDLRFGGRRFARVRAAVVGRGLPVSLIGQDVLSQFKSVRIERDRFQLF